jgi:hypothetical protein
MTAKTVIDDRVTITGFPGIENLVIRPEFIRAIVIFSFETGPESVI